MASQKSQEQYVPVTLPMPAHSGSSSGTYGVSLGIPDGTSAVSDPTTPRQMQGSASSLNITNGSQPKASSYRVGPYLLTKTLGVGSTGRVKLGTHVDTGQRVAVKILNKAAVGANENGEAEDSQYKKIEREITIMKLIRHPNVLSLYDVYETSEELFLVLEHVEGGELFDYLVKRGRLRDSEALQFFQQIIAGLDFCHQHLICHRDVKPENLLLDAKLNIKIADFGMASLQANGKMLETSCGSPHYASPEIIKGEKYDGPPADVWSCGVILYALLTGNLPFDDENIRKLLGKVKSGVYNIPDGLQPGPVDLIRRMLVVQPSQRITIPEIMRHPWFTSNGVTMQPSIPIYKTMRNQAPVASLKQLDVDIMQSLHMLGWEDKEALTQALLNESDNMEKVFYYLLLQRKIEYLEQVESQVSAWDGSCTKVSSLNLSSFVAQARRRTDSYTSLTMNDSRSAVDGSQSDIYQDNPLSPLSSSVMASNSLFYASSAENMDNRTKTNSNSQMNVNAPSYTTTVTNAMTPAQRLRSSMEPKSRPQPRPLSMNVAGVRSSPLSQSVDILPNVSAAAPPIASSPNSGGSMTNVNTTEKKKLTIQIPNDALKAMQINTSQATVGTPRFHRRPQVEPQTATMSPVVSSSSPKKSWFASIFNFKPETFSVQTEDSSFQNVEKVVLEHLVTLNVKYQYRKDGGIKCKYEPNELPQASNSASKSSIKFKIEIQEFGSKPGCRITLTHQQGPLAVFHALCSVFMPEQCTPFVPESVA